MEQSLVSIIVPIYNVEAYIEQCVCSILSQTYSQIEIILVDDGTPDHSVEIAECVLGQNKRFPYKVVRQRNLGVSAARNAGIAAANGQWIVMVDADDIIAESFVEVLVAGTGENLATVAFCDFCINGELGEIDCNGKETDVVVFTRWEAQKQFLTRKTKFLLPTLIVSKRFLDENDIKFDINCRYGEDVHFIWAVLCFAEKVTYITQKCYNYILHAQSTMTASGIDKIYTGYLGLEKLYERYIKNSDALQEVKEQVIPRGVFGSLHSAAKMVGLDDFKRLMERLEFQKRKGEMLRCGDSRISCVVRVLTVSRAVGYYFLRKF